MDKIAYLIPEFPGQTHDFFWQEKKQLNRRGVEVVLVSTRKPLNKKGVHSWSKEAMSSTHYLWSNSWKEKSLVLFSLKHLTFSGFFRCFKDVVSSKTTFFKDKILLIFLIPFACRLFDILKENEVSHVHVHSCANSLHIALLANLLFGVSYSQTLHGPLHLLGRNHAQKWRNSSFGVLVSHSVEEDVKKNINEALPKHLLIAPMGVDVDTFSPSLKAKNNKKNVRIVTCGRLNRGKGHHLVIQAMKLLKEAGISAHFSIAGGAGAHLEQEWQKELKNQIKSLQLEECVELLGFLSREELQKTLAEADIFVLASYEEGLGMAIAEAMAMELPVIATNVGGIPELISDGVEGLLIPPDSVEAIKEKILYLINHPEEREKMGKAGRKKVCEKFHTGRSAEAIIEGLSLSFKKEDDKKEKLCKG